MEILSAIALDTVLFAVVGMGIGIFFGALPGFSGGTAVALCLPIAVTLSPLNAMVFLINVYGGSHYGGGITSILLGVPGDAGGAPTGVDGCPMTRKGRVAEALGYGAMGSAAGGTFSILAFLMFSPMLARFALEFAAPEFFVLVVFGLTVLASVEPGRLWKGLFAGGLGMALASLGVDQYWSEKRMTFDIPQLYEGLPFIASLLGLFCVSQMMALINEKSLVRGDLHVTSSLRETLTGMGRTFRHLRVLLQSSVVGTFIGALPGAGAAVSAFVSYTLARNTSRHPEKFGTGVPDGIIAAEAANSSNVGGALIPTFALGIPGSVAAAILMGVMMFMGLRPGPRLFIEQLPLIQTIGVYLLFGCLLIGVFGALVATYFYRITRIPLNILIPCTIAAAALGAYVSRQEIFDVGVMLGMGVFGFVLQRFHYPLPAVVLGMVLGPIAEEYFIQSGQMFDWDYTVFFTRPICLVLWIGIAASLFGSRLLAKRDKIRNADKGAAP
ncbi:MAG: tripartite tricarboxylate transporter permease [Rhodospirillales bacterium]|nr:tripartite tricarboxylate transporter permease [Rhodospirillales bacterium]